ncbi:hypothetical protein ElyMa_002191200 [Elysia marginata]|uniref:Uncharacterized protein n=1 Tax=Elysia marginata TaxID=1093978 RepID=A0AAV4FQC1_9GAST|nr:hypothetical protein ElyMa_002191200 [Elysia marginata]
MALGCTVEDAEQYMEAVNQSSPVMEAIYGHGCLFGHPLNILKTTTASPDTTQDMRSGRAGNVVYRTGRRPAYGPRRSAGNSLHSYVSESPRRLDETPSPNNCHTFLPLGGRKNMDFFFFTDTLNFPGQNVVLVCCVLGFFLQTFLLRDNSQLSRNRRRPGTFRIKDLQDAITTLKKGNR